MSVPNHVETAEQIEPALAEIVAKLVAAFSPERIYLFGSRARGDARPDSDYDFMVVVPQSNVSALQRVRKANRVTEDIAGSRDILVLTHDEFWQKSAAAASLPATILREGQLIYATG